MKVDPVDEDHPTPQAIARGVNQVHSCLEASTRSTATKFKTNARATRKLKEGLDEVAGQVDGVDAKVAVLVGQVDKINVALRLDRKGGTTFATLPTWKAMIWQVGTVGGALAGAAFAYRFVIAAWPHLMAGLGVVDQLLRTTF